MQSSYIAVATSVTEQAYAQRHGRLRQIVSEALWRFQIFSEDSVFEKTSHSGVLSRVISSPTTLLTLCLRVRNYPRCYEIIKFFNLDEFVKHEVLLSETLHSMENQLKKGRYLNSF